MRSVQKALLNALLQPAEDLKKLQDEARNSNFKAGVGEYIVKEGKLLLESLR